MDTRTTNAPRWIISCVVAVLVTGLALGAAWLSGMENPAFRFNQYKTQMRLITIVGAVQAYQEKTHTLPRSLAQLRTLPDYERDQLYENGHLLVDRWNRPFLYFQQGKDYQIVSYGRDGKPGGVGLDCDLSNVALNPPAARLPFWEFLRNAYATNMVCVCLATGGFAFALCWDNLAPQELSRGQSRWLAMKLMLTLAATLVVGSFMAMLDQPSGH